MKLVVRQNDQGIQAAYLVFNSRKVLTLNVKEYDEFKSQVQDWISSLFIYADETVTTAPSREVGAWICEDQLALEVIE